MNRFERWLRIHVLRQRPEWHSVNLGGEGITVVPMSAEFVGGRNTGDITFGPLEAGGTIDYIVVDGKRYDAADPGDPDATDVTVTPDGWLGL